MKSIAPIVIAYLIGFVLGGILFLRFPHYSFLPGPDNQFVWRCNHWTGQVDDLYGQTVQSTNQPTK